MGSLRDRYNIYLQCAKDLGWPVRSFEEWCDS